MRGGNHVLRDRLEILQFEMYVGYRQLTSNSNHLHFRSYDGSPLDALPKEDQQTIRAAAKLLGQKPERNNTHASRNDMKKHYSDDDLMWGRVSMIVDAKNWANVITNVDDDGHALITGLHLLYARCVVISKKFQKAMDSTFSECDCKVIHPMMKKWARATSKCTDPNECGAKVMDDGSSDHCWCPWARLKDVLRVSARFLSVADLVTGYNAVLAQHTVVEVKQRLAESTHDVIMVIRFKRVLVEIQLHLSVVLDTKALSHAAYNFVRADSASILMLQEAKVITLPQGYSQIRRDPPENIKEEIKLNAVGFYTLSHRV